jgi:hypothetical protein
MTDVAPYRRDRPSPISMGGLKLTFGSLKLNSIDRRPHVRDEDNAHKAPAWSSNAPRQHQRRYVAN